MECDYRTGSWIYADDGIICATRNMNITSSNQTVTSLNGAANPFHDVIALEIDSQEVNFMPHGIEKFLPNLEMINITASSLQQISQADLKPFSKLKVLLLTRNEIEVIPDDLFAFNTWLNQISFEYNPIKAIGKNAIPMDLHIADFDNVDCVPTSAFASEPEELVELRKIIRKHCYTPDKFKKNRMFKKVDAEV